MKSCNNCKNYDSKNLYCFSFHIKVIDTISAKVCKWYKEKRKVPENIKCINCFNINKYGYCNVKKLCINENERYRDRRCSSFKVRMYRNRRRKF